MGESRTQRVFVRRWVRNGLTASSTKTFFDEKLNDGGFLCHVDGVRFLAGVGKGCFLITTASRRALGPIQPPIEWVTWLLFLGVRQPGRKDDHSLPSGTEVKNDRSYTSISPTRLHGVVLN
jgi:hypothetical protein